MLEYKAGKEVIIPAEESCYESSYETLVMVPTCSGRSNNPVNYNWTYAVCYWRISLVSSVLIILWGHHYRWLALLYCNKASQREKISRNWGLCEPFFLGAFVVLHRMQKIVRLGELFAPERCQLKWNISNLEVSISVDNKNKISYISLLISDRLIKI